MDRILSLRNIAFMLIAVGVIIFSVGGYQFIKANAAKEDSLQEAKEIVKKTTVHKEKESPITIDDFHPVTGETIGILHIPSINAELPIIEGTDPNELEKGVGHFKTSAFPSEQDQILLSGHRDTVFRKLGEVEIGDTFIVSLPYGDFTYEMVSSKIVDADDRTIIKSTAPNEELVVTTCYPFSYVGDAPERYIIYAKPVN